MLLLCLEVTGLEETELLTGVGSDEASPLLFVPSLTTTSASADFFGASEVVVFATSIIASLFIVLATFSVTNLPVLCLLVLVLKPPE